VAIAERTDLINFQADAFADLGYVLETAGQGAEAAASVARALRLYEQKGNAVAAERLRGQMDALTAA
jgi:hypothetical protein